MPNKSELVLKLHQLQDEHTNWLEIYNGTDGPSYSYLETIWEIEAEIKAVKRVLRAIWQLEKAQVALVSRKAA